MSVIIRIPTPMRKFTEENETVEVDGSTVKEALDNIMAKYPDLKERLCDESGELRRFVNVFINDEDIRFENGPETQTKDGDEISIVPAIAGG